MLVLLHSKKLKNKSYKCIFYTVSLLLHSLLLQRSPKASGSPFYTHPLLDNNTTHVRDVKLYVKGSNSAYDCLIN